MKSFTVRPSGKYWFKLVLRVIPVAPFTFLILVFQGQLNILLLPFMVAYIALTIMVSTLYFNSLRYDILESEIIVHSGVLTKTVKHVPFRTVTNIQITRGPLDRLMGLGSLDIQTAGTGSFIPEESLVGLADVQAIYETIAHELRRFQFGMSPTQAGSDAPAARPAIAGYNQQLLEAILVELRGLREDIRR